MLIDWAKIKSWALGNSSEQERHEVEMWGSEGPEHQRFLEDVKKYYREEDFFITPTMESRKRVWAKINPEKSATIRKTYWRYAVAASILLLLGIGTAQLLFWQTEPEKIPVRKGEVQLKLANGEEYRLTSLKTADSLPAGFQLHSIGSLQIKMRETPDSVPEKLNEISVPRYAEFQLLLADGTRVHLNAESTLRFPETFSRQRKVYLTGEAYFEVARDTNRPFRVETDKATIQVLGTQFNVKSYPDESTYTTLVSGSVKITKDDCECVLQPGQQCEIPETEAWRVHEPDLLTVLAWKNGEFVFKNASLEYIMKELARWYDIQVEYESDELRDLRLFLYIDRSERPEEVMDKIKLTHKIDYRIENKKIIIEKSDTLH